MLNKILKLAKTYNSTSVCRNKKIILASSFNSLRQTSGSTMSSLAGAASAPAARTALDEVSKDGSFQRTASTYHNRIGIAPFFAEEGRYHLYVAYACPCKSN